MARRRAISAPRPPTTPPTIAPTFVLLKELISWWGSSEIVTPHLDLEGDDVAVDVGIDVVASAVDATPELVVVVVADTTV